jgi:hypothetical protein
MKLTIELTHFGYERACAEAERQGVPVSEIVAHAVMYYLADLDSGRIATRILADTEDGNGPEEAGPPREARFRRERGN